jgi:hypothetical protein
MFLTYCMLTWVCCSCVVHRLGVGAYGCHCVKCIDLHILACWLFLLASATNATPDVSIVTEKATRVSW